MHSTPNFAVLEGESKHESSAKQQQGAMFVSDILEKLALSNGLETKISRTSFDFYHLGYEFCVISGHGA